MGRRAGRGIGFWRGGRGRGWAGREVVGGFVGCGGCGGGCWSRLVRICGCLRPFWVWISPIPTSADQRTPA